MPMKDVPHVELPDADLEVLFIFLLPCSQQHAQHQGSVNILLFSHSIPLYPKRLGYRTPGFQSYHYHLLPPQTEQGLWPVALLAAASPSSFIASCFADILPISCWAGNSWEAGSCAPPAPDSPGANQISKKYKVLLSHGWVFSTGMCQGAWSSWLGTGYIPDITDAAKELKHSQESCVALRWRSLSLFTKHKEPKPIPPPPR